MFEGEDEVTQSMANNRKKGSMDTARANAMFPEFDENERTPEEILTDTRSFIGDASHAYVGYATLTNFVAGESVNSLVARDHAIIVSKDNNRIGAQTLIDSLISESKIISRSKNPDRMSKLEGGVTAGLMKTMEFPEILNLSKGRGGGVKRTQLSNTADSMTDDEYPHHYIIEDTRKGLRKLEANADEGERESWMDKNGG